MNPRRLLISILTALLLALLLSACASTGDDAQNLTESISGEMLGGSIEINYPESWFAQVQDDTIRLSNNDSFLTNGVGVRREGDLTGGAMPLMKDALFAYGLDADAPMTEIARALATEFGADLPNLIISNPTTFTVDERRGAVVAGTARGDQSSVGRMAVAVIDAGDAVGVVMIAVFGDEVVPGDYARAIAETLTFSAG